MVAMVTARARVPAMACVGGPAVGRGARRRRDLLRRSATSAPTRLLPRLLPRLDRFSSLFEERGLISPPHRERGCGKYGRPRSLFSRGRLISEASLPVF